MGALSHAFALHEGSGRATHPPQRIVSRRRNWVCQKCTLRNVESVARCGACGSAPPSVDGSWSRAATTSPIASHASTSSSASTSSYSTAASDSVQFLWCAGEEAEVLFDGSWRECSIISAGKKRIEVNLNGTPIERDFCEVRRPRLTECCICLEPLCQRQLGAFVDEHGGRACRHYVHHSCGAALPVQTCPICRAEYAHIVQVPRADRHPREWFTVIDYSRSGQLSAQEVENALAACLPVREEDVHNVLKQKWASWDPHNHGYIEYSQVEPIVNHFFS